MSVLDVIDYKVIERESGQLKGIIWIFDQVTSVTKLFVYQNLKTFLGEMYTNAERSASYWPCLIIWSESREKV